MFYNPFSLENKIVLISGAGSGIGRATAIECSKLGAIMILTDSNPLGLQETMGLLTPSVSSQHKCFIADLTSENEIKALVDTIDKLDGISCNAGVMKLTMAQYITSQEMERISKINLLAPMLLIKHLLRQKKINKYASIVFTSSAGGVYRVSIGNAIYSTTKCGIDAYMRTLALELGHKSIRCNSVNPGMVQTNLINSNQFTDEQIQREKLNYPLGRLGNPKDIALAIIYLLSDASSWVTGTALKIDGGMTLK